jgi:hypothetical protein
MKLLSPVEYIIINWFYNFISFEIIFVNVWDSSKYENHNSITWFGNYFQKLTLHEKWHIFMHINK